MCFLHIAKYGGSCSSDLECGDDNTICSNLGEYRASCRCAHNFTYSETSRKCQGRDLKIRHCFHVIVQLVGSMGVKQ